MARSWAVACVTALASMTLLAGASSQPPPLEWIEAATGHRVVRVSSEPGSRGLYFHQNAFTASGDKLVISTTKGLATVTLATRRVEPLVEGRVSHVVVGRKSRQVFYIKQGTAYATGLDTGATRTIAALPQLASGSGFAINADETLLAGSMLDQAAEKEAPTPALPAAPRPAGQEASLEARWAARRPMNLYTLEIASGRLTTFHHSTDWLNHVQFSPTDPSLIMFCHEGPWHKVDRIWTIRSDGSELRKMHARTMDMEIAGHEFFAADGKTIWFDLQTPRSQVFWLAGVNTATAEATVRYPIAREHWSVHFNVSADGTLFAGDGGGPKSVAAPGNGQWICLFTPRAARLEVERLVDLAAHDYTLEPNVMFTPDGKWIVFSANVQGAAHVYIVEVAKAVAPTRHP